MRLYFWFVLKTVMITLWCFSYSQAVLMQCQGLFYCSHCPTREQAWGAQNIGRGHCWDSWSQMAKGIFHTISCHVQQQKLEGGGWREGRFPGTGWASVSLWWVFVLIRVTCWVLIFLSLCHCFFSILLIILSFFFFLSIRLFLSEPRSFFLTFTPAILLHFPTGGESAWLCGA